MDSPVPTLCEWLGGGDRLAQLIHRFYQKVPGDPVIAPLFAGMPPEHFQHVADFVGEVFGGPPV
jgi:hemoglobin